MPTVLIICRIIICTLQILLARFALRLNRSEIQCMQGKAMKASLAISRLNARMLKIEYIALHASAVSSSLSMALG